MHATFGTGAIAGPAFVVPCVHSNRHVWVVPTREELENYDPGPLVRSGGGGDSASSDELWSVRGPRVSRRTRRKTGTTVVHTGESKEEAPMPAPPQTLRVPGAPPETHPPVACTSTTGGGDNSQLRPLPALHPSIVQYMMSTFGRYYAT